MLYGITGAHRSGKTTLGQTVADDLGIEFMSNSTTEVAKSLGFDPVAPMTLTQRVDLQVGLLDAHIKMITDAPRPLIVDRTPLDMIGYCLAEFNMTSAREVSKETLDRVEQFVRDCLKACETYYDHIIYLSPLTTYETADDKPDDNRPYQMHHALLVQGAMAQLEDKVSFTSIEETDFEWRRNFVHDLLVSRIDHIAYQVNEAPFH